MSTTHDTPEAEEPIVGNCPECDAPIGDGMPGCVHWPAAPKAKLKRIDWSDVVVDEGDEAP